MIRENFSKKKPDHSPEGEPIEGDRLKNLLVDVGLAPGLITTFFTIIGQFELAGIVGGTWFGINTVFAALSVMCQRLLKSRNPRLRADGKILSTQIDVLREKLSYPPEE